MSTFVFILIISVAIMAVILAVFAQRNRPWDQEESDPDYHILHSDYQSGMGGGSVRTWKVPKDPQEYARYFVPKSRTK
ncbi:MAG: hypothetical protein ACU0BB_11285 [Paracoccaceae bacterium]|jgi:hypothetical protein